MAGLTLDSGALIAHERGDPCAREILRLAFERGHVPTIPAVAVIEAWRGGTRTARLAKLLKVCIVERSMSARVAKPAS